MIDKLLIGIAGHKNSGKDSVANALFPILSRERKVLTYHIGNTIAATLANMTGGSIEKITMAKNDPYMRGILQYLGAERRQREGADVFVRELDELYRKVIIKCFILIPSVRYMDEYNWIKTNKGLVIRVFRPTADDAVDQHETEQQIRSMPFDHSVINDANIGHMEFYTKNLAHEIIKYGSTTI